MMVEERYFYDPVAGQVHRRSLPRRPGEALRRHRLRADLAGLSEHRHRQPQPARPAARHAGRAGRRAQMVADFHRRGVRVLFPVMPWDTGTRQEGVPLWEAAARDMKAIGADGINGDTMRGVPLRVPQGLRRDRPSAGARARERAAATMAMLAWNNMSLGLLETRQPIARGQQVQVDRAAAHGQRLRALGEGSHRRPAVGLLQRRGLRELGERLGHLEPVHAARRRGPAADRDDRAGDGRPAGQPRLGAARPDATSQDGSLCQPLPRQGTERVAAGQPRRQGHQAARKLSVPATPADEVLRPVARSSTEAALPAERRRRSTSRSRPSGYGAVLAIEGDELPANVQNAVGQDGRTGKDASWQPLGGVEVLAAEDRRDFADQAGREAPEGMVPIPAGKFRFRFPASRSKATTTPASTCSTRGKICRGAITTRNWTSRLSTSTSTRSPTPSSRGSSRPPATGRRTTTTS